MPLGLLIALSLSRTLTITLFAKFSDLMEQGLTRAVQQITTTIKADLQGLGARSESVEKKLETTVPHTNQNTPCFETLQQQLEQALAKIDDLENRSHGYNFRIFRLLVSVTDVEATVHTFLSELLPNLPERCLDLHGAHQALQLLVPDRPP